MLFIRKLNSTRKAHNCLKFRPIRLEQNQVVHLPLRTYTKFLENHEMEKDCAEANPIKVLYREEVLHHIVEIQRMKKLAEDSEPRKYVSIKGVYPEIVEDQELTTFTSNEEKRENKFPFLSELRLDKLTEEQAFNIVLELNKDHKHK